MITATSKQKKAMKKNTQQWIQFTEAKPHRCGLMCWITVFVISCVPCVFLHETALGFNTNECVLQLTKEVDPQYRLSQAQATARCDAIARRIDKLSKQIVGKWQHRENGQMETMVISADGTARIHRYYYDTGQMRNVVEKWSIDNPYGTIGDESLKFEEDGFGWRSVKFTGNTMTITSQPATATIVERWTRLR